MRVPTNGTNEEAGRYTDDMTMRIHIKHTTLVDPIAIMIPEYAHLDTLRRMCASEVGIEGDFDLLLDNACRTKITSLNKLRDEDVLIVRSKRTREADEEDDVRKRARTSEVIVLDDDETVKTEKVTEEEVPEEEETPATTPTASNKSWPSNFPVECTDFDRSFSAWKGKRLVSISGYLEPGDFPGIPCKDHDPLDIVFGQDAVFVDNRTTIPMTGPSDDAFQFLSHSSDMPGAQVRELPPDIRLLVYPRRYESNIYEVTGTGTHFLVIDEGGITLLFKVVSLHVTCISLTSRIDRRDHLRDEVTPHLPQLVVFDAIKPSEADDAIVARMKVMPKAKEGAREKKSACWNSHVSVLRGAIAANTFPHLIMEDDITIPSSFDVPIDALPKDGVCFLAGKINAAKVKDFKEFEKAGRAKSIASTMARDSANRLDKSVFRISSSAAYVVPTRKVAQSLLAYLETKNKITHYDIDLFECPVTTSMWYPSPFHSEKETAKTSDIMPSQSQFFTTDYTRMV